MMMMMIIIIIKNNNNNQICQFFLGKTATTSYNVPALLLGPEVLCGPADAAHLAAAKEATAELQQAMPEAEVGELQHSYITAISTISNC